MDEGEPRATIVIETPRLTLRELTTGDLDDLAAMYADAEVMRFIGTGGVLVATMPHATSSGSWVSIGNAGSASGRPSRARRVRRSASAG